MLQKKRIVDRISPNDDQMKKMVLYAAYIAGIKNTFFITPIEEDGFEYALEGDVHKVYYEHRNILDEILSEEQIDQELFDVIFKGAELPEGMTHAQAIGKAIAAAVPVEELEDLIEVPSRETFDEWIRLGEERRREREKKNL